MTMPPAAPDVVEFLRDTIARDFAGYWPSLNGVVVLDAGDSQVEVRWFADHHVCAFRTAAIALRPLPEGGAEVVAQPYPPTPDLADALPAGVVRVVHRTDLSADVPIGPAPAQPPA